MKYVVLVIATIFVVSTILPAIRRDAWWIRAFDFPRPQVLVGLTAVLAPWLLLWPVGEPVGAIGTAAIGLAMGWQAWRIAPYTPLWKKQVATAELAEQRNGTEHQDCHARRISLMVSNVLMDNRDSEALLGVVRDRRPDVLLTVEVDDWWDERLSALDDDYPHALRHPLPNTYGIILQSRLELVEPEVRCLLDDDIPSIKTGFRLPSGDEIRAIFLHPKPPAPQESKTSTLRDAELLIAAREVLETDEPIIVAGDLNDVAWSYTTRLFQRVSELLDPRIGRGMFNSFHAKIPLFRWALDHVFHSEHFLLVNVERLPAVGSDHFPVYIELELAPVDGPDAQLAPTKEDDDTEVAARKIQEGVAEASDAESSSD